MSAWEWAGITTLISFMKFKLARDCTTLMIATCLISSATQSFQCIKAKWVIVVSLLKICFKVWLGFNARGSLVCTGYFHKWEHASDIWNCKLYKQMKIHVFYLKQWANPIIIWTFFSINTNILLKRFYFFFCFLKKKGFYYLLFNFLLNCSLWAYLCIYLFFFEKWIKFESLSTK